MSGYNSSYSCCSAKFSVGTCSATHHPSCHLPLSPPPSLCAVSRLPVSLLLPSPWSCHLPPLCLLVSPSPWSCCLPPSTLSLVLLPPSTPSLISPSPSS